MGWAIVPREWAAMTVQLGIFLVPDATRPQVTLDAIVAADHAGLDLVGIQDHPYQWRFFDTWTLLAYAAARTQRIRVLPDVINLPLRSPSVLAKAAASLDVLSGGRVELGLGAGAFWDGVAAMGGPRRTPKESVDALQEAIAILRAFWSGERSVTVEGEHYAVKGAHPGPPPAHAIGLWIGAYRPRMLRLTGRLGDGWLPSMSYLEGEDVAARHEAIDEAARKAGRDPSEIRRALNVGVGDWDGGADRLATLATEQRFETLILSMGDDDPLDFIRRAGQELAPGLREALG
jgi:alkanesulfonate monooxygenase SsuD/methylene tetrahydromethanopterin reductase-like flavin-dependent oxidoreductase (luciferase family)